MNKTTKILVATVLLSLPFLGLNAPKVFEPRATIGWDVIGGHDGTMGSEWFVQIQCDQECTAHVKRYENKVLTWEGEYYPINENHGMPQFNFDGDNGCLGKPLWTLIVDFHAGSRHSGNISLPYDAGFDPHGLCNQY